VRRTLDETTDHWAALTWGDEEGAAGEAMGLPVRRESRGLAEGKWRERTTSAQTPSSFSTPSHTGLNRQDTFSLLRLGEVMVPLV